MDKLWLSSYPPHVREEIDPLPYKSLADFFYQTIKKFSNRKALISFKIPMKYADLGDQAQAFSQYLLNDLQLVSGDRLAIMLVNTPQFYITFFGAMLAGVVVVPINPLATSHELKVQLTDSEALGIVALENFMAVVQRAIEGNELIKGVVVTRIGDCLGWRGVLLSVAIRYFRKIPLPAWELKTAVRLSEILKKWAIPLQPPTGILDLESLALIQYTGGTTGVPKGAMLSHRNLLSNAMQIRDWIGGNLNPVRQERIITILPLYHIFSLTAHALFAFHVGAVSLLVANPRDLNSLLKDWKKFPGVTLFIGVNALFASLLRHPKLSSVDFSKMNIILGGGAALQKSVVEEWTKKTGTVISEAYGLSETSPGVTINYVNGTTVFTNGIGYPLPSTRVRVLNEDLEPVPIGESGELCVSGPQVMSGYWKRPAETAEVFTEDGYFRTGDIVICNEKGFFQLVDRKKDIILVAGFNVYPNEVEAVLVQHPNIFEAAVVGVPDKISGELVKAFVILKDSQVTTTASEIRNFCRVYLTSYKIPRLFDLSLSALPKSAVGKVLRRELR